MGETEKPLDLNAIEARLGKITPGPWVISENGFNIFTKNNTLHIFVDPGYRDEEGWHGHLVDAEANTIFIANAPTDIAALVAEVKRLREHLRILEDTLAPYLDDGED